MIKTNSRGKGFRSAFVSLMIVVFFIVIAMAVFFGSRGKGDDNPIKDPIERGKGVECLTQRKALEFAIQQFYGERGRYPHNLSELEGLEDVTFDCPVTFEPYDYDPKTGKVTCREHP